MFAVSDTTAIAIVVPLGVAVIGGPLMWLLHRFDQRNTEQHNANFEVLERIRTEVGAANGAIGVVRDDIWDVRADVREVGTRLTDHINDHLHGEFSSAR